MRRSRPGGMSLVCCLTALAVGITLVGCGFDRLDGDLPAAVEGLSLSDLEDIQDDERLTDDEKRDRIRDAVGAPDNDSGDRLVEFLLTFNVP